MTRPQQYRKLGKIKATFDIPDDLYRRVKARSALQGRPIRSVAVALFQKWLEEQPEPAVKPPGLDEAKMPWLAITRDYVREYQDHDMAAIKESIAAGWGAEVAEKLNFEKAAKKLPAIHLLQA